MSTLTKYESKKHPGVFITTDGVVDKKFNTLLVTFEDGKTQVLSIATIKRWWKPVDVVDILDTGSVDDATMVEQATTPDEPVSVEPAETVEPEPKKPAKKKEKSKPVSTNTIGSPKDFVDQVLSKLATANGGSVKTWESEPRMFGIVYNDKQVMDMYFGKKCLQARVHEEILSAEELNADSCVLHKNRFNATIQVSLDSDGYDVLNSLIARSIAYKSKKTKTK